MDSVVSLQLQKPAFLISSPEDSDEVIPRAHFEKHLQVASDISLANKLIIKPFYTLFLSQYAQHSKKF